MASRKRRVPKRGDYSARGARRHRTASGPRQLWRCGFLAVPAQGLHQGRRLFRRRARPADRRHHQHLQRLQSLPRQRAGPDRGGEARRHAGRRPAHGLPDRVDPRELLASDQHVPAQPDVDRHRGDDPRPADGLGGADRRLRQDPAGPAHGGGQRRPAGGRAAGRADAGRPLQGRGPGRLHRLPPAVGPVSRRHFLREPTSSR